VHVLEARRRLSDGASRGKQRGVTADHRAWFTAGLARVQRGFASGLVPAYAPRCATVARSHVVVRACGRRARLVNLLFLRAKGVSPARDHDSTHLRGFEGRKAREGAGARSLPCRYKRTEEHIEYLYRYRRCIRTRGIQGGCSPRIGSPHHAARSERNPAIRLATDRKLSFEDRRSSPWAHFPRSGHCHALGISRVAIKLWTRKIQTVNPRRRQQSHSLQLVAVHHPCESDCRWVHR
jgi:hypothetical protein